MSFNQEQVQIWAKCLKWSYVLSTSKICLSLFVFLSIVDYMYLYIVALCVSVPLLNSIEWRGNKGYFIEIFQIIDSKWLLLTQIKKAKQKKKQKTLQPSYQSISKFCMQGGSGSWLVKPQKSWPERVGANTSDHVTHRKIQLPPTAYRNSIS